MSEELKQEIRNWCPRPIPDGVDWEKMKDAYARSHYGDAFIEIRKAFKK
jgi:hypothetical protein